jgi:hypothetical protein
MDQKDFTSDSEKITDEMIDACLACMADKERRLISVT